MIFNTPPPPQADCMPACALSLCVLSSDVFLTQFSALQTSRSVRTRRLAAAEENTEVTRTARLAHIFKEICDMITSYKGKGPHAHRPGPRDGEST